jgi:hypothetical protein
VYPAPDTHWRQLIDLSLFADLHPGISLDDVRKQWGEPNSQGTRALGPYWTYQRSGGTVVVYLEEQGSPPFPYTKKWFLEGVPYSTSPSDLFHPSLLERLPDFPDVLNVIVMTERHLPGASVRVENGEVRRVTWLH